MKKSTYILILITLTSYKLRSQDVHFSQYFETPTLLNPAYTGTFNSDLRTKISYRNQWATLGNPYKTTFASIDAPITKNNSQKKTKGLGLNFYSDKAGKSNYGRTEANISYSQSIHLDEYNELSLGLAVTLGQISANFTGLKWDNQYNGTKYIASNPTGEGQLNTKSTYFDIGAGILWRHEGKNNNISDIGISIFNVTQNWQATLANTSNDDYRRYRTILHAKTEIPISDESNYIIPSFYYSQQSNSNEIIIGAIYKTQIGLNSSYTGYYTSSFLYGGLLYRYKDAVIVILKYEWQKNYQLGVSYDINVSKLMSASKNQGGFEIAFTWIGDFF